MTLSRRTALLAAGLTLVLSAGAADARPRKCIDAEGKVTYSDTLCPGSRNSERQVAFASPQRLTVERIEAMAAAANEAQRRKDFTKLMSYYADDAVIEVVVRFGHRTGRQALRKREMIDILRRHADDNRALSIQHGKLAIDIMPNGMQAETREKLTETFLRDGKRVTYTYEEQTLIEMRDGKPQVTHAYVMTDAAHFLVQ